MRLGPVSEKAVYRNLTLLDEGPPDDLVSFATARWLLDEGQILIGNWPTTRTHSKCTLSKTLVDCGNLHLLRGDLQCQFNSF